jgi:hypothetical protein
VSHDRSARSTPHLVARSSLFESLQTLFWGTFGLIDLQTFQIYKKHTFTMFVGLLMFGVYCSIMIIVLLNMLIAMMSSSYQYIAVSRTLVFVVLAHCPLV